MSLGPLSPISGHQASIRALAVDEVFAGTKWQRVSSCPDGTHNKRHADNSSSTDQPSILLINPVHLTSKSGITTWANRQFPVQDFPQENIDVPKRITC